MPKTIHGMSHSRLYQIWNGMTQRCSNPKTISYKYYGGKGITVCDEWKSCFKTFCEWAMANGYADNLTIDRIDRNGNYEPSNCRWASYKVQQNNTSYNRLLTYCGETHNITQWAEITGIQRSTLYNRIRRGWNVEKALTKNRKKEV